MRNQRQKTYALHLARLSTLRIVSKQLFQIALFATAIILMSVNAAAQGTVGGSGPPGGGSTGSGGQFQIGDFTLDAVGMAGQIVTVSYTLTETFDHPNIYPYAQIFNAGGELTDQKLLTAEQQTEGQRSINLNAKNTTGDFTINIVWLGFIEGEGHSFTFRADDGTISNQSIVYVIFGNVMIPSAPVSFTCDVQTTSGGEKTAGVRKNGNEFGTTPPSRLSTNNLVCETCPSLSACGCYEGSADMSKPMFDTLLHFRPSLAAYHSSGGPGYFLFADSQIYFVDDPISGKAFSFLNVQNGLSRMMHDVIDGSTADDVFHENSDMKAYAKAVLSGNHITVHRHDGITMKFELWDDDDDSLDKEGRLVEIKDRNGNATTIAYSGGREISSITDPQGFQVTMTYGTTVAGRKALTAINYPNGASTSITYANDFINEINHPEGIKWTCGISNNGTAQTTQLEINDPRTGTTKIQLAQDFMEYDGDLVAQPANVFKLATDGNDAVKKGFFFHPTIADQMLVWYGGNKLSEVKLFEEERFIEDWDLDTSTTIGYGSFTNLVKEPDPYFERSGYSAVSTNSEVQKVLGIAEVIRTETGDSISLGYDTDGYLIREDYDDGTFVTYTRNSFKQVLRLRNRRGYVTLFEYDSNGNLLRRKEGLIETAGGGEQQVAGEYGVYEFVYDGNGRLITAYDPLGSSGSTMHRTDFVYYANGQLHKVQQGSDVEGGPRAEIVYTYNAWGLVDTITDRIGNDTSFEFDDLGRLVKITYDDLSTETTKYGEPLSGDEARVVLTKDRMGIGTSFTYDTEGRLTQQIVNAGTVDGAGNLTPETDVTKQQITNNFYLGVTSVPLTTITDGKKTNLDWDYRHRVIRTKVYPQTGKELVSHTYYVGNRVFRTVDPYGRSVYHGYSASLPNREIRTIVSTHPDYTITDNTSVLALSRSSTGNDEYLVTDMVLDAHGNVETMYDQKNNTTTMVYDSRDRLTRQTDAVGTTVERKREFVYDVANNMIKMYSPRHFDSSDPEFGNVFIDVLYNGRNLPYKATAGTSATTLSELTYALDEKVATRIDMGGNTWTKDYDGCCGLFTGNIDPLGHGNMTNRNYVGLATHQISVSNYAASTNKHDPVDANTLNESTVSYDALRRPTAATQWLSAQGAVNHQLPSNAGLWGNPATNGLTGQAYYDNNIGDGIGLDSTTGMTIQKLGGGTYSLSLDDVISKLDDPVSGGGALVAFTPDESSGSAVVSINGEEEITVAIADGIGRTVITATLQPHDGPNPLTMVTHVCRQYDNLASIGFGGSATGNALEVRSIDVLGNVTKVRMDGAGRALQTVDADGNVSTATYDEYGSIVSGVDPANFGISSSTFDDLGRVTSRTDTRGQTVSTVYDKADNPIEITDAKGKKTYITYDNLNHRKTVTDRVGGVTTYAYNAAGQLGSIMDSQGKVTSYEYTTRGELKKETFADHVGGSSVGATGYGIRETAYDPLGRTLRTTDQSGATKTFVYDMVNRMTSREYRTLANSPSGTVTDSDTFTYDNLKRILTADSQRYSNTVTLGYDFGGRLSSETLNVAGQNYTTTRTYNGRGLLDQMIYPDGSNIQREYSNRGQLSKVKYNGTDVDTRTYDVAGRLSTSTLGNTASISFSYETGSRLLAGITTTTTKPYKVPNYAYTYDENRNKTSETISAVTMMADFGFDTGVNNDEGFDDEDRLVKWDRSDGNLDQTWNLSLVGDWDSFTSGGTTLTNTHSNSHELTAFGTDSISYDVKGNVTENANGNDYSWDFDNMLTGADTDNNGTDDVTFEYDALGRRVRKGNTVYALAGAQVVCEYIAGGLPSASRETYVYGSYVDEPILKDGTLGIVYYHRNAQFSVTCLTDIYGNAVEYYTYDAYGAVTIRSRTGAVRATSNYKNTYFFTGRRLDHETGLYYFRARYYDAEKGRFVSRDPLGFVDGMSEYQGYFAFQGVDPTGLFDDLLELMRAPIEDPRYQRGKRFGEETNRLTRRKAELERIEREFKSSIRHYKCDENGFIPFNISSILAADRDKELEASCNGVVRVSGALLVVAASGGSGAIIMTGTGVWFIDQSQTGIRQFVSGEETKSGGQNTIESILGNSKAADIAVILYDFGPDGVVLAGGLASKLRNIDDLLLRTHGSVDNCVVGSSQGGLRSTTLNPIDLLRTRAIVRRAKAMGMEVNRSLAGQSAHLMEDGRIVLDIGRFTKPTAAAEEFLHGRFYQISGFGKSRAILYDDLARVENEIWLKSRMMYAGEKGLLGHSPSKLYDYDWLFHSRLTYLLEREIHLSRKPWVRK